MTVLMSDKRCRVPGGHGRGRPSRYVGTPGVDPVHIERYPGRSSASVDARLAALAARHVLRYEDFFVPPGAWSELHHLTQRRLNYHG